MKFGVCLFLLHLIAFLWKSLFRLCDQFLIYLLIVFVAVNDGVDTDEVLAEIETDKVRDACSI